MSGQATGALSQADVDAFRCLAAVEAALAKERQKTDRIQAALEILLQRTLNLGDTSALEVNEQGTTEEDRSLEDRGQNSFQMKPSNPPDFDGDQAKGQGFLNSCNLYFSITGGSFPNEQARIGWTLTFFKSGCAAEFADLILRTESETGRLYHSDWKEFETDFKSASSPTIGKQLFKQLIHYAGYKDGTQVVKFRKGLSKAIRMQIATSEPVPRLDSLDQWVDTA
ncbi:hypothetical protein M422DRAFT_242265 [Sphaerobolus stellatus SS14]|nr:hypothetical protein M422DRAFT_242265 [Sphaerobolus stellatus SS14]